MTRNANSQKRKNDDNQKATTKTKKAEKSHNAMQQIHHIENTNYLLTHDGIEYITRASYEELQQELEHAQTMNERLKTAIWTQKERGRDQTTKIKQLESSYQTKEEQQSKLLTLNSKLEEKSRHWRNH